MLSLSNKRFHDPETLSGKCSEYESEGDLAPDKVLGVGNGHIPCADSAWSRRGKPEIRASPNAHEAADHSRAEHHRGLEEEIVFGSKCGKIARLVQRITQVGQ